VRFDEREERRDVRVQRLGERGVLRDDGGGGDEPLRVGDEQLLVERALGREVVVEDRGGDAGQVGDPSDGNAR
jgi:hypothetical protein